MKVFGNYIILIPSVVFPATVITTYILAVTSRHLAPVWPYISHTGDFPIESCIFSLGLNIVGGFYMFILYVRYFQIEELSKNASDKKLIHKINIISLPFAIIASFSLALLSSAQQVHVLKLHFVAAISCSITSLVYFCLQTVISFKIPQFKGLRAKFRLILNVINISCHIAAPGLWLDFIRHDKTYHEMLWWSSDEPGYYIYIAGAFLEWIVTICNNLYVASFYTEFKRVRICKDDILFLEK